MGLISTGLRLATAAMLAAACTIALLPAGAAAEVAERSRERRSNITITGDDQFTPENGVRSGSGTAEDPYVISGWDVSSIRISDTDAPLVITDNSVNSQLVLNWTGRNVQVVGNDIWDLRVNQNVRRTGLATSGVISDNTFRTVGQLRHWDGVFEDNVVGVPPAGAYDEVYDSVFSSRSFNFDGFNGAVIRNNTIYGYMDARLHGHHHSSDFGDDSHYHGPDDHMAMDHSERYHEVTITGNRISAPPAARYALAYLDTNHAANDRTASSEQNEALNDPHVHYTRVHITDNELVGAGLEVNVFNARNERHRDYATGMLHVEGNTIHVVDGTAVLPRTKDGIYVRDALAVHLSIVGNHITGETPQLVEDDPTGWTNWSTSGAGISLTSVDEGLLELYDNTVADRRYGIRAASFTESVHWWVDGLRTRDVEYPISASNTVANPHHEGRADAEDDDDHDDGGGHDH